MKKYLWVSSAAVVIDAFRVTGKYLSSVMKHIELEYVNNKRSELKGYPGLLNVHFCMFKDCLVHIADNAI